MDLGAEQRVRHRAADQGRGDVVEERGQHEYNHEQREAALPVVRKYSRELRGHARFLEVSRQEGEAEQQTQEVREDHPLLVEMREEPGNAAAGLEPREGELVQGRKRDPQRVTVKHRDTDEREPEQNEIDRDAEHRGPIRGASRSRRDQHEGARTSPVGIQQHSSAIEAGIVASRRRRFSAQVVSAGRTCYIVPRPDRQEST